MAKISAAMAAVEGGVEVRLHCLEDRTISIDHVPSVDCLYLRVWEQDLALGL